MYYIGQEIIAQANTLNYKEGDRIIIHRIDRDWLYDDDNKQIHQHNVAPSFTAGDTVWDTQTNTTFVVHRIVDDQVYSLISASGSILRGRPIRRVRSGKPPVTPATPHPDTERLDWLLGRVSWTTTPVTREDIDRLRGVTVKPDKKDDGWNEAIQKCAEAVELYAISYMTMSKMGDGKVSASDVAYDLRNNVIARNFAALKGARK